MPSEVNLSASSIDNVKSKLMTDIDFKFSEVKAKLSDDIQFQLRPSQAYLDELEKSLYGCKENITSVEKLRFQSDLQQEKWFFEYNNCSKENSVWMYISLGLFFVLVVVIAVIANGGFPFRPKIRNL